jgi:hypothetical protein
MAVIAVARPLREKLGEEATDALVALINEADESNKESVIELVEERFEHRLGEEIGKLRTEMNEGFGKIRMEMTEGTSKLRTEMVEGTSKLRTEMVEGMSKLRTEMADLRANLIQWMFLFWIGQIGVLTGILFAFFRK